MSGITHVVLSEHTTSCKACLVSGFPSLTPINNLDIIFRMLNLYALTEKISLLNTASLAEQDVIKIQVVVEDGALVDLGNDLKDYLADPKEVGAWFS